MSLLTCNGFPILQVYDGPSRYNGEPICAYLVAHQPEKIGAMSAGLVVAPSTGQTFSEIMRAGGDLGVCGGCRRRSPASGGDGSCYVRSGSRVGMALNRWLASAHHLTFPGWETVRWFIGQFPTLRSAVWGDAAALPVDVWAMLEALARGQAVDVLGYTHGWRTARHLVGSHMASVESEEDRRQAEAFGFRTYRVAEPGTVKAPDEIACPMSKERNYVLPCSGCLACGSKGYERKSRSVAIQDWTSSGSRRPSGALKNKQENRHGTLTARRTYGTM